jgi:hypothetical protein
LIHRYFIVDRIDLSDGSVYLIGRTGESEIPLNHRFSEVYRTLSAWEEQDACTPCALIVMEIFAYGRCLEFASPGLTARIRVEGSGIDALQQAKILV